MACASAHCLPVTTLPWTIGWLGSSLDDFFDLSSVTSQFRLDQTWHSPHYWLYGYSFILQAGKLIKAFVQHKKCWSMDCQLHICLANPMRWWNFIKKGFRTFPKIPSWIFQISQYAVMITWSHGFSHLHIMAVQTKKQIWTQLNLLVTWSFSYLDHEYDLHLMVVGIVARSRYLRQE